MESNRALKLSFGSLMILVFTTVCWAVPAQINYQGYLTDLDGFPVVDGDYEMVFRIYDVATLGTPLWSESQSVAVRGGVYNVTLGLPPNELHPADLDGERYLGVTVGGDSEMTPRQLLTSVPTALVAREAGNAITLNGIGSEDILTVSGGTMTGTLGLAEDGLVVGADQLILSDGNVGIGTATPQSDLTVAGTVESTSGGFKFPDGTVQISAATADYRGKVLALATLLDRPELGASFPTAVIPYLTCNSGQPVGASFAFNIDGVSMGKVVGFMGEDRISETYAYSVAFVTGSPAMDLESILGRDGNLVYQRGKSTASFPGVVTEFGLTAYDGREAVYVARLEPRFALLRWQVGYGPQYSESSLADIVSAELHAAGLVGTVENPGIKLDAMRFNESTAAFLSRILEREGCHYHFDPASGVNVVMGYSNSVFLAIAGGLNYHGHLVNPGTGEAFVASFHHKSALLTGSFVLTGWDYYAKQRLEATANIRNGIGERREYWADASNHIASHRVQVNMEREINQRHRYTGTSTAGTLKAGRIFALSDKSGAGLGGSYLVTGVRHMALYDDAADCYTYCNAFSAIPSTVPFRPERKTPHPQVPEVTTALVTDNTDPEGLGRVRVKFPWDDTVESAWARVIGSSGHINADDQTPGQAFIPAVDNEVMVTFLQGNPALPVVLGGVHNGEDMPPAPGQSIMAVGPDGGVTINSPADITIQSGQALSLSSGNIATIGLDEDNLSLSGYRIDLGADAVISAVAGMNMDVETANAFKINAGGDVDIKSSTSMDLDSSLIRLNGGGAAAARVGDLVSTPTGQTTGTIFSGSSTVQIGP